MSENSKDRIAELYDKLLEDFPAQRADKNFMTCGLIHEDEEAVVISQLRFLAQKICKLEAEAWETDTIERALGFIHGALWAIGELDLEDIRNHLKDPEVIKDLAPIANPEKE
jgi:hypothetical protein